MMCKASPAWAFAALLSGLLLSSCQIVPATFQPKQGRLPTRWTDQVNSSAPLPEFPRPQMQRPGYPWLSLNGAWQWAPHNIDEKQPPFGRTLNQTILVPFPPESSLSGLELNGTSHMWYRVSFRVPEAFAATDTSSQPLRTLLHFGAVDWQSTVYVNSKLMGTHRGGYDSFTYDITSAISSRMDGLHELVVDVWDPTEDANGVPLGKQRAHTQPGGITYTACSGIWQSVWLEAVPHLQITGIDSIPDIDAGHVVVTVKGSDAARNHTVVALVHNNSYTGPIVGSNLGYVDGPMTIPLASALLWTPDTPNLYALTVYLFKDDVNTSNLPKFGADGLLAAPQFSQADIIDKTCWNKTDRMDHIIPDSAITQFNMELERMILNHRSVPSIVFYEPFNEGWGQFPASAKSIGFAESVDPSRIYNGASGWTHSPPFRGGQVLDIHDYNISGPTAPMFYPVPNNQLFGADVGTAGTLISAIGEFGGIGKRSPGHEWDPAGSFAAQDPSKSPNETVWLTNYNLMMRRVAQDISTYNVSAAIYTQLTDVEQEVNGLLTYDRLPKFNVDAIRAINNQAYAALTHSQDL